MTALEIFKLACYIYLGGFLFFILMGMAGKGLKGLFPNWYARHISNEFEETTGAPEECFDCNLDERYCYKQIECAVVKQQMVT